MNGVMTYRGYDGLIRYSEEDRLFFGVVQGVSDKITFEGESVDELEKDFHEAVDDYLAFCRKIGKEPDKTYRGSFNVRIAPELHREACRQAGRQGISLNQFVETAIRRQLAADSVQENYKSVQTSGGWISASFDSYADYGPDMINGNVISFHRVLDDDMKQRM